MNTPRAHFKWMGKFYSCSPERIEELFDAGDNGFEITMDGCRELRVKPKGQIPTLEDYNLRHETSQR